MPKAPLVSIVIPTHNHARYLDEAIASVLSQTYAAVELIVLDDGSTDGTRALLEKYGDRFYWETHPNMGQANTLNKGWRLARGEILGYLSADDRLLPGSAQSAVELLQSRPDLVLTYCDFQLIDPHGKVIRTVSAPEYDYRDMVVNLSCPPGPGVFFRRSAFQSAGGWDPSLRQMPDYDYWLRLGLLGSFQRIPKVLAAFRVHESSLTFGASPPEGAEEPVRIIESYFRLSTAPAALRAERARALSSAHVVSAQLHLRAGRYTEAWLRVRTAYALSPESVLRPRTLRMLANGLLNRLGHRVLWSARRAFRWERSS